MKQFTAVLLSMMLMLTALDGKVGKKKTVGPHGIRTEKAQKRNLAPLYVGVGVVAAGVTAYLLFRKGGLLNRGTATLRISSKPLDGKVYIDGKPQCSAPCTIKGIEPGKHKIKVEREFYGKWEQEMELKGWKEYEIEAELSPFVYERDRCIGEFGEYPGEFRIFFDIAIDDEQNIYVADWQNSRIQKFNSLGKFIYLVSLPEWPEAIVYSHHNKRIYVVSGNPQMRRFTLNLALDWIKEIDLKYPHMLGVDDQGKLYIVDGVNSEVLITSPEGKTLDLWHLDKNIYPEDAQPSGDGRVYVSTCMHYTDRILVYNENGEKIGEFPKKINCATTIALDPAGNVYVTGRTMDWMGGVYKFLPDGTFVQLIGKDRLASPEGIAIYPNGDLIVGNSPDLCIWKITDKTINEASAAVKIKSERNPERGPYATPTRSSYFSALRTKARHRRKPIRK